MISPPSGENSVLQLNMGEGKSSVIVPIVAAAIADSRKLVRVVVLKSLAGQMFQILVERLSGLSSRRIFYLPFSRQVTIDAESLGQIRSLFETCAASRGVLVAQPEHILSFKLKVIDRMLSSSMRNGIARDLWSTQTWLTSQSRDILDESDELLHTRYHLIYTMDHQQPLDDSPDRWITIQQVLRLVRKHLPALQEKHPDEVELVHLDGSDGTGGAFPHVRLTGIEAPKELVEKIVADVVQGQLDNLHFNIGSESHSILLIRILSKSFKRVASYNTAKGLWSAQWKGMLLLRGLLANGMLEYVLHHRRWRVDYGLDTKRSLLAVPFRAKVSLLRKF